MGGQSGGKGMSSVVKDHFISIRSLSDIFLLDR